MSWWYICIYIYIYIYDTKQEIEWKVNSNAFHATTTRKSAHAGNPKWGSSRMTGWRQLFENIVMPVCQLLRVMMTNQLGRELLNHGYRVRASPRAHTRVSLSDSGCRIGFSILLLLSIQANEIKSQRCIFAANDSFAAFFVVARRRSVLEFKLVSESRVRLAGGLNDGCKTKKQCLMINYVATS